MNAKGTTWLIKTLLAALLALTAIPAFGQAPAADFPTFKGDYSRTGKNGTPTASMPVINPDHTTPTWFHPNDIDGRPAGVIVDNLDAAASFSANWTDATADTEAPQAYNPTLAITGAYKYASTVRSHWTGPSDYDPTSKDSTDPGTLEVATYTLTPTDLTPRSYALYIWIPSGATNLGGLLEYPITHFVYEIDYGAGQKQVGTYDITQGTGNWARFGKTDANGTPLFPFDGVHPIVIKLYNTVARDVNTGALLDTPGANSLVYADAFEAVPANGSITASPTVHLLNGGTDGRVIVANNLTSQTIVNGSLTEVTKGVINSYSYNDAGGALKWSWSPSGASGTSTGTETILDNDNVQVTSAFPFATDTTPMNFYGSDFFSGPITNTLTSAAQVSYEPIVTDGLYDVYVWLAGYNPNEAFGTQVQYEIDEGAVATTMTLDQRLGALPSSIQGWSSAAGYSANDLVFGSDGNLYQSLQNSNSNHNPVPPDNVWWAAVTSWSGASPYVKDQLVFGSDGLLYRSLQGTSGSPNLNNQPVPADHVWWNTAPFQPSGWVKLGTRSFKHDDAHGNDLTVLITNYSALAADSGKSSYADAVLFLPSTSGTGTGNQFSAPGAILSTPAQVQVNILQNDSVTLTPTEVTIVCAEDGHIYCLDSTGNANGTTNVIWTYPTFIPTSTTSWNIAATYAAGDFVFGSDGEAYRSLQAGNIGHNPVPVDNVWWTLGDPNHVDTLDGKGGKAQMPTTGFGMSSPTVLNNVNIGGTNKDLLFIGAANGRVYAIDMAGRGDFDFASGRPGTTPRIWSYPDDFPANTAMPSSLGPFIGSVAVSTTTAAGPTVFAPVTYGTGINQQGRMIALDAKGNGAAMTTTPRWMYPALTSATTGAISSTPAVDFGNVYYGTAMQNGGTLPGTFYALNQDTGALLWSLNSFTVGGNTVNMDNFLGGPTTVSATEFNNWGGGMNDTVFAANENQYIFAFDATTGAIQWQTNELHSGVKGALTYTPLNVFTSAGVPGPMPTIMVPTENGQFASLFARTADLDPSGKRKAWDYVAGNDTVASIAVGLGWMYTADLAGYIYAFSGVAGTVGQGAPPGGSEIVGNQPDTMKALYAGMLLKFVSRTDYITLRKGQMTYADFLALSPVPATFEFGQTIYAVLYNYPYASTNLAVANFAFSANGLALRSGLRAQSQMFQGSNTYENGDNVGGYALLSYTTLVNGTNSLVPGTVTISPSLTTNSSIYERDASLPDITFNIANPFALVSLSGPAQSIAWTPNGSPVDPTTAEAQENGSGDVAGGHQSQFTSSIGTVSHSQTGTISLGVVDRSLYTLLRGPGRGLDSVKVSRSDLSWNRNMAVVKPLPAFTSADPTKVMEDLPVNYPNTSLDYPDIRKRAIRVTKDPTGSSENPIYAGVRLIAPKPQGGADLTVTPTLRDLVPTPFQFQVDVPRYQPANNQQIQDSALSMEDGGYAGIMTVYADNNQPTFDITATKRTAYRTFILSGSVGVDERLSIGTPTVDLGSVPMGSGFSPTAPWQAGSTFNPYTGPYTGLFQPFVVKNEGNVNLVHLRLAHGVDVPGLDSNPVLAPWQIMAPANDLLSWLDSGFDLWSDMDQQFYNTYEPQVVLQKARVGDLSASQLSMNPIVRANPNLGVQQGNLLPTGSGVFPAVGPPKVGVSLPIGFPSGTYSTLLRVIEDDNGGGENQALDLNSAFVPLESQTDPSFILKFTARESQITNTYTALTAPFADDLVGSGQSFMYSNKQPTGLRDLNGNLVVAWASDRRDESTGLPTWNPPTAPTGAVLDPTLYIYVGLIQGAQPVPLTDANSPLNDLNNFVPDTSTGTPPTRWLRQGPIPSPTPLPAEPPASLFQLQPGDTLVNNDHNQPLVQFHYPSLPSRGFVNPIDGTPITTPITMAFTGEAQIQTQAGGRSNRSMLFATTLSTDNTGKVTVGATKPLNYDLTSMKGRPSVIQFATQALIFYESAGTGESVIDWVTFNPSTGAFSAPTRLSIPNGFESVGSPSISARPYVGTGSGMGPNIIDMLFTGKLRGRAASEVFFGRIDADAGGVPTQITYLPAQSGERLVREGEPGLYRAVGVAWNPAYSMQLYYRLPAAVSATPLLATSGAGVPTIDPASGLIVANTPLGRVYLDPGMGTVRFATAPPNPTAEVTLDYQPEFIRVSTSASTGFSGPSLIFDNRLVNEVQRLQQDLGGTLPPPPNFVSPISGFWAESNGAPAAPADQVRAGRFIATYGGAAAGAGHGARPYMKTWRLGVQLPSAIYVNASGLAVLPDGTTKSITIAGATSFWQIDPAQGKVYFTPADEDSQVTITYTGVDGTGNIIAQQTLAPMTVGMLEERGEAVMPIELATNESNVTTFIDPFDLAAPASWNLPGYHPAPGARPDLFWILWSSTRRSGSDIFFQTLAPKFTPVLSGK